MSVLNLLPTNEPVLLVADKPDCWLPLRLRPYTYARKRKTSVNVRSAWFKQLTTLDSILYGRTLIGARELFMAPLPACTMHPGGRFVTLLPPESP